MTSYPQGVERDKEFRKKLQDFAIEHEGKPYKKEKQEMVKVGLRAWTVLGAQGGG